MLQPTENGLKERNSFGGKPMQELAYRIGILLSSYSQAINNQNKTTGSLFQQKTKAKILAEDDNGRRISYFEQCFHYIHLNPVKAKLVTNAADWAYSSYSDYIGLRNGSLCNKELFFSLTRLSVDEMVNRMKEGVEEKILEKLF
ncbi:MAG TPA: hypothetical protein VF476_12220 [Chitinophagaceae bacterium]